MVAILCSGLAFGRWDGLLPQKRERRAPDSSGPASAVSYGCLRRVVRVPEGLLRR
jgi:hypothetical protein